MDFQHLIKQMNPEVYQQLKQSLELSKWPNGASLTQQQKEICMEAVIAYEHTHLTEDQRTGYVEKGKKITDKGVVKQPINLIDILDVHS